MEVLEKDLISIVSQIEQKSKELKDLEQKIENKKKEFDELKDLRTRDLRVEIEALEKRKQEFQNQLQKISEQIVSDKFFVSQLRQELSGLKEEKGKLLKDIDFLKSEIEFFRKEKERFLKELETLKEKQKFLNRILKDISKEEERLGKLRVEIDGLKKEKEKLEKELKEAKIELVSIRKQKEELHKFSTLLTEKEKELKVLENDLKVIASRLNQKYIKVFKTTQIPIDKKWFSET